MKKLIVRETAGRFDLENFGPSYSGADGRHPFSLVIASTRLGMQLEFPETLLFDLFPRFDLRDPYFRHERYRCPEFVRVVARDGLYVVEARSGTLHDFFQERVAAGYLLTEGTAPVHFARAEGAAEGEAA